MTEKVKEEQAKKTKLQYIIGIAIGAIIGNYLVKDIPMPEGMWLVLITLILAWIIIELLDILRSAVAQYFSLKIPLTELDIAKAKAEEIQSLRDQIKNIQDSVKHG